MNLFLGLLLIIPLTGFLISLLIPKSNEKLLSLAAFGPVGFHFLLSLSFVGVWLFNGMETFNIKEFVIYSSEGYEFFIDLYFDKITAVYLLVGSLLTFLITIYSRYYMHREEGYKRFFNTLLFFYLGYNITIFSGNFETLFIGWEILGVSSFLLIAFYRDRYLPVKNAMKVFSVYRVGDIGLILAMWLSHHLWHENITFFELNNHDNVSLHLHEHSWIGLFTSLLILLAAMAKSAQFPFSFWLPRAMEGPTPSSAIFYSSLSVHIGVFILLRTFPFWEHQTIVRAIVIILGLVTAILASSMARVQSSVKAQVAYSSVSQIGIIFIEVAFGFETLALIHFAGNAFLRTYQLLVSPSVVTYLIREQFYNFQPREITNQSHFRQKISNTIYLMSLKEWSLDSLVFYYLWAPVKRAGNVLRFITPKIAWSVFAPLFVIGSILLFYQEEIPSTLRQILPIFFAFVGLILSLKSFVKRHDARFSWLLIFQNHLWIALAITFNAHFSYWDMVLFLSGVILSGIVGYFVLNWLGKKESNMDLNRFQGHSYEYKKTAFIFLLACLGMAGFPITPTFVGEDLIFSHIEVHQVLLLAFVALSFIINGLALIRLYARIFMGPHIKTDHPISGRSA
ncbi:MAG: hypothetical protein IPO32_02475 [Crocinitomicaceae bacterium]|nr:hypothetical protein [Crocinitomicaceae bacterium]